MSTNITDFDPETGRTTTTLVDTHDRGTADIATQRGESHDTWHRWEGGGGGGEPPLLDEPLDGTAGQSVSTSGRYVAIAYGNYKALPVYDGAGHAVGTATDYGTSYAVHTTKLPPDCWSEVGIIVPTGDWHYRFYHRVLNAPDASNHFGYGPAIGPFSGSMSWEIRRDDGAGNGFTQAGYQPPAGLHVVRLESRGNNHRMLFDGEEKINWTDPNPLVGGDCAVFSTMDIAEVKVDYHRAGAL